MELPLKVLAQIDVEVRYRTKKAWLVATSRKLDEDGTWLPKSMILAHSPLNHDTAERKNLRHYRATTITIPEWLARKTGLQPPRKINLF